MGAEAVVGVDVQPEKKRSRVVVSPVVAAGRRRATTARRRVQAAEEAAAAAAAGRRRRARRRVHAEEAGAVQRLFQACRGVFRGPGTVPAPAEVALLRAMLDKMRPEDVGLRSDVDFFTTKEASEGVPAITHTTIYKCDNFSMVILFLPQNAVIPLHNHPGMTVFSKLLLGSMHIKSYDWVHPDPVPNPDSANSPAPVDGQLRLAKLVCDDAFTAPCDTSVLYPTAGGNMHRFTAMAPCAILDILGPPYSIEEDRDCTYYADIPFFSHSSVTSGGGMGVTGGDGDGTGEGEGGGRRGRLAWLREIDMPRDLKMCSVRYGGPPISDR